MNRLTRWSYSPAQARATRADPGHRAGDGTAQVLVTGRQQFCFGYAAAQGNFSLKEGSDINMEPRHWKTAIAKFVVSRSRTFVDGTGEIWGRAR